MVLLLCCCIKFSQSQVLPYEKYTSKNGLISDRITAITQDEKGFMWFGSYFGICRYDGIKFEKINLPPQQQNKFVTFLLPANNKIYAGFLFNSGLFEYSRGKGQSYFIKGKDSVFANEFICGANGMDGSILLANSSNMIYQFKDGNFSLLYDLQQKVTGYVKTIERDQYKNIWIATPRGLLVLPFPYNTVHRYFINENIFSLLKDKTGKIWFCKTDGINTTCESSDGWQHGVLLNENKVSISGNLALVAFSGNTAKGFWGIDTDNRLVNIFDNKKENRYKASINPEADINSIFSDRENNIWIANEPGVLKISNFNIQSYLFNEIAANGGAISVESDSSIWATNSKFLYRVTDNNIQKAAVKPTDGNYYGNLFLDHNSTLWAGFWDGGLLNLKWRNGKTVYEKYFRQFNNKQVKAQVITEDSHHNIWVAGFNGIFRIKNNKIIENFHPVNTAGNAASITAMVIDEKNYTIWAGDNASGLMKIKYKPNADSTFTYKEDGYISGKNGLNDTYIRSLLLDHRNTLWVGTRSGGIYSIQENNNVFKISNHNSEANILCARVTDIRREDTSAVWFATCDGIYRYQYAANKWTQYNTSHGLLNAEVFSIAVDAKNDVVWALTAQGLTKAGTGSDEKTPPPLINITGINVLGKPDPDALLSNFLIKYSYTQNSIGFTFAGASYIDEKKIKYKYMLQGYDNDWSDAVMTHNVNYASLPPGKYVFKVVAANAKNQWSIQPATFQFQIVMPVYRRPWFIFALIIVAILIAYLIRVQQMNQRFKIEKLRLNIARDLHDDVGSTLGSINLLSKTAIRRLDKKTSEEEITPVFKKIGESAENTLEAMDDIVWSINPQKDKVQDVIIRMREFAIPLLEAKDIQFSFSIEGNTDLAIPMNLRRNAFLIFKEAIYNVIKHAEADKVRIEVRIEHNRFIMIITDNGKGFNPQSPTQRNGVKNMHSRAETVNGTIQFNSSPDSTSILFNASIR